MRKEWIISDTHFYHRNIIRYCNRPFTSVEQMNQVLIENWNSLVKSSDVVFMLGDFALGNKEQIIELGKQLKGQKVLIMGNHDGGSYQTYWDAGFEMISRYPIIIHEHYILSHDPQPLVDNGKYANIYGHIHDHDASLHPSPRAFCACVERTNYKPVLFNDIKNLLEEKGAVWQDV